MFLKYFVNFYIIPGYYQNSDKLAIVEVLFIASVSNKSCVQFHFSARFLVVWLIELLPYDLVHY